MDDYADGVAAYTLWTGRRCEQLLGAHNIASDDGAVSPVTMLVSVVIFFSCMPWQSAYAQCFVSSDENSGISDTKIARDIILAGYSDKAEVQIAYAIGVAQPVSVYVETFGTEHQDNRFIELYVRENYDLTPRGIIKKLNLLNVDYNAVSVYGHFGKKGLPWEE